MTSLSKIRLSDAWLPDVNFWLALAADQHEHHKLALDSFEGGTAPLFFCRVTQMGLVRLLTNSKVMADEVLDPTAAIGVYMELIKDHRIDFAPKPPQIELAWTDLMCSAVANNNPWTDAYLAAFALKSELTIVSFDKGMKRWPTLRLKLLSPMAN